MFLPASPPLCPCLPERGSAGPTGRPRPRAEASDSWPGSQPQVTPSLALPLPRGLLSLLGELGNFWASGSSRPWTWRRCETETLLLGDEPRLNPVFPGAGCSRGRSDVDARVGRSGGGRSPLPPKRRYCTDCPPLRPSPSRKGFWSPPEPGTSCRAVWWGPDHCLTPGLGRKGTGGQPGAFLGFAGSISRRQLRGGLPTEGFLGHCRP